MLGARPRRRPAAVDRLGRRRNIGHLEAAAGIAGLIKAVLALQHGEIPPHLHFREPNPHIAVGRASRSRCRRELDAVAARSTERRIAGVSSFGFSGTNAHVVLEEAPAIKAAARPRRRLHCS